MGAIFLVVGFVVLLQCFGLVERSKQVVALARRSTDVIRSAEMTDETKEAELQKNAIQLFKLFFILAAGGLAAFFLPIGVLWLGQWIGWISLDAVFAVTLSLPFLIGSTILVIAAFVAGARRKPETEGYSTLDRVLHHVAFNTYPAQVALADAEDRLFAESLATVDVERPVFITALPRAGTTLLLELCARLPEFASHCYRDMPFVLTPCLWQRFSASFRKSGELRPRAHGDGMMIDFDSPEALEEVLWKTFWKSHYLDDRIVPWQDEDHEEFDEFFRNHMRKIVWLRRGEGASNARYLSKNNLNIARTRLLRRLFPEATILVPVRDPLQHAGSLLGQHQRFARIHGEDRFASHYMRAIGHFDFGDNLRPVDFDGWLDRAESRDADGLAFWLEYWVAAYRHLLACAAQDGLCLLSYELLCADPERGLRTVAELLDLREPKPLLAEAAGIRDRRPREIDITGVPPTLLREVKDLYDALRDASRNSSLQAVS